VTVTVAGCVITTVVDAVHDPLLLPLGALATIVYVPVARGVPATYATLFTVSVVPEPEAVIVPSFRPLQLTLVELAVTVTVAG
jgi:hypothetical protein